MGSRQKATWSQVHGGSVAFFVICGVICCIFPVLFLLVIPLGILCGLVTLAGFIHAKINMGGTVKPVAPVGIVCGWCGKPEPKKPIGWRLVAGVPKCPNCP